MFHEYCSAVVRIAWGSIASMDCRIDNEEGDDLGVGIVATRGRLGELDFGIIWSVLLDFLTACSHNVG